VICVEARYASVIWRDQTRIDRKFASPMMWQQVARELREGWPNGLVDHHSVTAQVLTDILGSLVVVQFITATPIEAAPHEVVRALDARLEQVRA
jgi:hypothetical protein